MPSDDMIWLWIYVLSLSVSIAFLLKHSFWWYHQDLGYRFLQTAGHSAPSRTPGLASSCAWGRRGAAISIAQAWTRERPSGNVAEIIRNLTPKASTTYEVYSIGLSTLMSTVRW